MRVPKYVQNILVGSSALLFAGAQFAPNKDESGPVLTAAVKFVTATPAASADSSASENEVATFTKTALTAFTGSVRPLSRPEALENAFKSYFAYKTAHPAEVKKPLLYFVDYGLPSTERAWLRVQHGDDVDRGRSVHGCARPRLVDVAVRCPDALLQRFG